MPKGLEKNAASEYKALSKMGFISLEEVDQKEVELVLASFKPDLKSKKSSRKLSKLKSERAPKDLVVTRACASDQIAPQQLETKENILDSIWTSPLELKGWSDVFPSLHPALLKGISEMGFSSPTPIQDKILGLTLDQSSRKDILGSAPTGSGKTLAFLLPVLNHFLLQLAVSAQADSETLASMLALIIVPTRELAMQIEQHLRKIARFIPPLRSVTLMGGMSQEKQERLLSYSPQILVGTPGRLAEIFSSDTSLQTRLANLEFLVLDEADRLSESGHFKDLDTILELLHKQPNRKRRTFVFSATLSGKAIGALKRKLHFNDKKPHIVSETLGIPQAGANITCPDSLKHSSISCLDEEKVMHLYALLKQRLCSQTLIFVNAISLTKELASTLSLLGISCGSLHAQMPQKQRMKVLDRFRGGQLSVLVTSDVAARGLDIPSVTTVVHYHVPRALDIFVHRSGRTARANQVGTSISLVAPHEAPQFRKLVKASGISPTEYPLNSTAAEPFRKSALLAHKIARLESQQSKEVREKSWEEKAAEALGVDIDNAPKSKRKTPLDNDEALSGEQRKRAKINQLKHQLAQILQ